MTKFHRFSLFNVPSNLILYFILRICPQFRLSSSFISVTDKALYFQLIFCKFIRAILLKCKSDCTYIFQWLSIFFFRCSSNFSQDLQNRLYSIWLLLTSFGSSLAILATNPRLGAFTHVAPSVWHYLDYTESFLFCLAQPFMLGLRFKNYILIHRIAFYKIDVDRYLWEQSFI